MDGRVRQIHDLSDYVAIGKEFMEMQDDLREARDSIISAENVLAIYCETINSKVQTSIAEKLMAALFALKDAKDNLSSFLGDDDE